MGKLMQFAGTMIICNLCMGIGVIFAWPSSTLRLFESTNTTLHRPMKEAELALFGSLTAIGALTATPVVGLILNSFGRKNCAILSSLLGVIAWTMIACSSRVEVILTAMFVCGLSGGALMIVPVYIGEICQESIRGAMCSFTIIFYGVGLLISYLLGGRSDFSTLSPQTNMAVRITSTRELQAIMVHAIWKEGELRYLEYRTVIYVSLTMSVLATAALTLVKESPICLMLKGKEKEAAASLAFYRSLKPDSKEVLLELNTIRRSLNPELDDVIQEEEKQLKPEKQIKQKIGIWTFIKNSSSTRSAIYMTLTLITASVFQGIVVVQVYAEPLFEEAITSMSPNVCSILLAGVVIVAGLIAAYLSELVGRRPLLMYSAFGSGASCLLLGLQLHLHWGPNWLIAVNIYCFVTAFSLGCGIVPYVLIAEVFLPEVKSFMSMLVMEWAWFCSSIILFIFNPLLKAIGLGPVFYIFAAVSVMTGIYSMFCVPETKGLSIDAIQDKFSKKKSHNVGS